MPRVTVCAPSALCHDVAMPLGCGLRRSALVGLERGIDPAEAIPRKAHARLVICDLAAVGVVSAGVAAKVHPDTSIFWLL